MVTFTPIGRRTDEGKGPGGGHHIPYDVILRRYEKGLNNFFKLYLPIVDQWFLIDNSGEPYEIIAENPGNEINVNDKRNWDMLKHKYDR